MKRTLLAVAAAAVMTLFVASLDAKEPTAVRKDPTTIKMVTPDWHYRWHDGCWWYWMPENSKWMVWIGSTWVPFEQFSKSPRTFQVSAAGPSTTDSGNDQISNASKASQPAPSVGDNCPPNSAAGSGGSSYSSGSGSSYAGYGWSWGPGTAYRDGPARRF